MHTLCASTKTYFKDNINKIGDKMSDQDWKSKIAAMLAKAHGKGTTIEEARAFEEKAAYLMNKLGIEESELRVKTKSDEKPISEVFKKFAPYANSKEELLVAVANCLGGRVVLLRDGVEMHVFAFSGDLDRIKMMYFSLLAQMHIEAATLAIPKNVGKRVYTNSWLKGFVYGASKRLQRAYGKANSEANALVIYDRDSKVQAEMKRVFGKLVTKSMSAATDSQGFNDGVKSGLAADVGQDRFGRSPGRRAIDG